MLKMSDETEDLRSVVLLEDDYSLDTPLFIKDGDGLFPVTAIHQFPNHIELEIGRR